MFCSRRSVRLGEYDVNNVTDCQVTQGCSDPPQIIEIEEIIPHSGWIERNPSKHNDIALLRLKRDVKFSRKYCVMLSLFKKMHFL